MKEDIDFVIKMVLPSCIHCGKPTSHSWWRMKLLKLAIWFFLKTGLNKEEIINSYQEYKK